MTADQFSYLFFILLAMHISYFVISGIILLIRNKEQHDRSRLIFSLVCFVFAFGAAGFIYSALKHDNPHEFLHLLLDPLPLVYMLPFFTLVPAYIIEVLCPHWLRFSRVIGYLSPWIVTCIVFFVWFGMQGWTMAVFMPLHSCQDIVTNIHQPNVIFRLVFLTFYLFYSLLTCFVPYNPLTSNVSLRWKWILQAFLLLTVFGFVVGVQLRIIGVIFFYWAAVDAMIGSVLWLELRIRIPVPTALKAASATDEALPQDLSELARRLQVLLDEGIWQNPEIHRELLCETLATNRTYLSGAVRELGFDNVAEMVHHHRMQYVEQQLQLHPNAVVTDLLFQAGYRNRTSAMRYFQHHLNNHPSQS